MDIGIDRMGGGMEETIPIILASMQHLSWHVCHGECGCYCLQQFVSKHSKAVVTIINKHRCNKIMLCVHK